MDNNEQPFRFFAALSQTNPGDERTRGITVRDQVESKYGDVGGKIDLHKPTLEQLERYAANTYVDLSREPDLTRALSLCAELDRINFELARRYKERTMQPQKRK